MKKKLLILSVLFILLVSSCKYNPDYTYKWDIKVTYTNGDIDTLHHESNSFKGNPVVLYLKTSESGVLVSGGTTPCLVSSCGFYYETIVCGVRKYDVIKEEKSGPLPKKSWK